LNQASGPWRGGLGTPRSVAQSAGLSVSALTVEKQIATDIVTANCWYTRPVMPGMKPTGTKMASSTSVVAMTALVTCSIVRIVAVLRSSFSVSIRYWTRSTTRMASSTTEPMARTSPKSVSVLML
jgi:hypothetical protein